MWASTERFLLTLWVGSLLAIGYLAVPILFSALDDRMLAGQLAGRMFTVVSLLGLVCAPLLMAVTAKNYQANARVRRLIMLAVMLALVLVGEFVLQPMMAVLKAQGIAAGSEAAGQFARLHGVSSILYMINSLLGLGLVIWQPK